MLEVDPFSSLDQGQGRLAVMAAIMVFIAASFSVRNGVCTGPAASDAAALIRTAAISTRRA
jgi:hypothetical protein